jgi:sortase A
MKRWVAVLAVAGLMALAYCAFVYFQASRFQAAEKTRFAKDTHAQSIPAEPSAPREWKYPSRGEVLAELRIPRIGLSSVVLEGSGPRELKLGPGHISSTPLPGQGGNFAVAGHRDTFFRALRSIVVGDVIQITSREREFQYKVVSTKIVGPRDVLVLQPTGSETLTLVTCYPFDYLGPAPKRFIVRADCEDCLHQ